jgi:GNAT superfamily N-acetyltransferase
MIRDFSESDTAALEQFKSTAWAAADAEHWGENPPDFSRHHKTVMAVVDNQVLGYGTFSTDAGVALIEDVLVHPDHYGEGIGTELVQHIEAEARSLGCHKAWLLTGTDWKARFLYEKLGYTLRTTLPNHYGRRDFLHYDKML